MNSPRKYSSPYLTTIPGLTPSSNRLKRRSRTSIVKVNESGTQVQIDANKTTGNESVSTIHSKDQIGFGDASCGDVDQAILKDIKAATKSIDASHVEASKQEHEDGSSNTEGAAAISSISHESVTRNDSEANYFDHNKYTESTGVSETGDDNAITLKSILKKPSPYKDKSKRLDLANNSEINKRLAKSPKGKNGRSPKEFREPLNQVRPIVKQRVGAVPISPSRTNTQQRTTQPSKSPRRKAKGLQLQAKAEEKPDTLPSKKSVRFSHKVEVHTVPYESRAGTRACDWQRNMLEQRMQAFRQLMKDVNTEELDFIGNGMLFPGFSFQAPPQNSLAVRGRGVRNLTSNYKL